MVQATGGNSITSEAQILDGTIVNADINASAAIAASKLQALSVGANGGVIPSTGVADAHVSASAAIAKTKLGALDIVNADVNASAAIAKSKLASLDIVNADVNASAAIVDTKLAQITTASKVSGAALTSLASIPSGAGVIPAANIAAITTFKVGQTTRNLGDADSTLAIAHGLGATPKFAKVHILLVDNATNRTESHTVMAHDGTTAASASVAQNAGGNWTGYNQATGIAGGVNNGTFSTVTITIDSTNINLAFAKTGTPTGDCRILWEACV